MMNKDEKIFKRVKEHLYYLKENHPNYNVIYIGLQGSQNYELDTYTEEYMSDVDTKAILVPSLKDISLNKKPVSTTIVLPNNEHIDCKDIRLMMDNFKKQNVNFVEILFTKYKIINKEYKDIILELLDLNEDIAHLNENQALRCMSGMSMEKKKALCHPYPNLLDKIKKYGYDGKQLHHIIRMNDFINAYTEGKTFKECLTTYQDKEFLMKAKLNEFSLEQALYIADSYDIDTKNIKDRFLKEQDEINKETVEKMNDIQYRIIKRSIENELKPVEKETKIIDPNNYKNVYVTSDLHLCHSNALKFEEGRQKLLSLSHSDYIKKILKQRDIHINQFNNEFDKVYNSYYDDMIDEFNEKLIERYNSAVDKNDLVYILGDIALNYNNIEKVNELISKLNGDKILILGNHDKFIIQDKKFDRGLFKEIVDYKEIKIGKKNIVLSHFPIARFNRQDVGGMHLYGHIHSTVLEHNIPHAYNVGVDANDYKPVNINDFIDLDNRCFIETDRHTSSGVKE